MPEFHNDSGAELTKAVGGKTITEVLLDRGGEHDYLVFRFSDYTCLRLRYDWIYDWELRELALDNKPVLV